MRLRLETDEAYCGSLQEKFDNEKDHLELLGLDQPVTRKLAPPPKPMTRQEYLDMANKRRGINNE